LHYYTFRLRERLRARCGHILDARHSASFDASELLPRGRFALHATLPPHSITDMSPRGPALPRLSRAADDTIPPREADAVIARQRDTMHGASVDDASRFRYRRQPAVSKSISSSERYQVPLMVTTISPLTPLLFS
jgi:hypothetical protein